MYSESQTRNNAAETSYTDPSSITDPQNPYSHPNPGNAQSYDVGPTKIDMSASPSDSSQGTTVADTGPRSGLGSPQNSNNGANQGYSPGYESPTNQRQYMMAYPGESQRNGLNFAKTTPEPKDNPGAQPSTPDVKLVPDTGKYLYNNTLRQILSSELLSGRATYLLEFGTPRFLQGPIMLVRSDFSPGKPR